MKQLVMDQLLAVSARIDQAARNGRKELEARLRAARFSLVDYLNREHRIETVIHPDGRIEFLATKDRDAA